VNFGQISNWLMFWRRGEKGAHDMPYSIVLLMREVRSFTETELEAAGERGWGKRFDGEDDPMYFVSRNPALTILKAGKYVVQLIEVPEPYSDDLEASAQNLPRLEQKKSWFEHRAWTSLDLWNGKMTSKGSISKKE
jgi:hypothetical protein